MGMQSMTSAPARNQLKAAGKPSKIAVAAPQKMKAKASPMKVGKAPPASGPAVAGFGGGKPHGSTLSSGHGRSQTGEAMGGGGAGHAPVTPGNAAPASFLAGVKPGKV